jgi:hypothetical protein
MSSLVAAQQPGAQASVNIQIVEGDGAINSIRLRRGHDPVVRVITPNGEPVSGAMVTFLAPSTGPSGTFSGSGVSMTVQTDDRGIAAGRGFRPNNVAGQFRIRVTTSWLGAPASASLAQTNTEPVVRSGRGKTIAIIAVIAGAAVGGAVAAVGGGGGSSNNGGTSAAPPPGGITAGTPTIGPPN